MELPRGIFWLRAASGISEAHILSLMRMADSLYREILILTDLPLLYEGASGKVSMNGDIVAPYHYCFLSDARSEIRAVHDRFSSLVTQRGWRCWMPPRPEGPTDFEVAKREAFEILNEFSFDAVCHPNVMVNAGPNRDVIFTKSGIISSVMCPNSGDGFWREVFRSSGQFDIRASIQVGEI